MGVTTSRPGFWLQHASRETTELLALATQLATTAGGRPGIAFGPLNSPSTLEPAFRQARQAGDAIVDPHGHLLDRVHTARSRNHFSWLALTPRPVTQQDWESWMEDGLAHQTSPGLTRGTLQPSFVVTPSPTIEASRAALELHPVLDAAAAVAARQPAGTDCWLGVAVDRDYMRESIHLTRLANAMLASGAKGFVFRASHSSLAPVEDRRYLAGLREIVEACAANDIRIYLPGSGWLGWLAMGWGAWGFSGGMAAGTWADRVPGPMTRPQRPSEPFFELQLMRSLRWSVHQQLAADPSYQPCGCSDCITMGGVHDLRRAKRHQIRLANTLGFDLTSVTLVQRRVLVADRIDDAIAFRDGLPPALQTRADAGFLDRWRALL